jgi:Flp pilus assembly protein TadG
MNRFSLGSSLRDERGVSAVEFALIVPVVLILLIGMVYINEALTVHRRLRQVTFAAADLIAQQDTVSEAGVTLTMAGAAALLSPYETTSLELVLTLIEVEDGDQSVVWSRAYQATPETAGNDPAFPVPDDLILDGVQTVAVRADYTYRSIFSDLAQLFTSGGDLVMRDHMYERPRISDKITISP